MKRIWIALLALCLLAAPTLAEVQVSGPNEFPIVNEPVELTAWASVGSTVSEFETDAAIVAYEEKTGVHINWISVSSADRTTLLALSLASGDTPDMYLTAFNNTYEIYTYGQEGVLRPLNDLIDEYSVNAKTILEEVAYLADEITAPDGNIYTLFRLWEEPNETINSKMFVFTSWLEKAGLDMPETLDEFKEMLVYFRDHDMNENGDATDEIPLLGTYQYYSSGSDPLYYLMEAFQLFPGNNFMLADAEGNITFQANTQAFRDGLIYVNDLFEEGLLAEQTYVQDLTQYRATVNVTNADQMIVGCAAAPYYMRFVTQSIYADAYKDFKAIPPLKSYYDGETRQTTQHRKALLQPLSAITTSCAHPEVALKWLDYWLGEEGTMSTDKYGTENIDWTWSDEYTAIDGTSPAIIMMTTNENAGTNRLISYQMVPTYVSSAMFGKVAVDENSSGRTYPDYTAHMVYQDYAVFQGFPNLVWCPDEELAAEFSEYKTQIDGYVVAGYTQFVMGVTDIESDADWNAYLDGLNELGLDYYLELARQYYFG